MDYNFHSHTVLCNHATGTAREYIEAAISVGIKEWGFSEHIPFIFPNGVEYNYRVPVEQLQAYIDTVNVLKEEYKDKINIHLGFEMEYYEEYFDEMLENARRWGAEYLILGQHSVGNEPDEPVWCVGATDHLTQYVSRVVSAIESGVFTYIAHPDNFIFTDGDEKTYNEEMTRIIKAAEKHKVPLEINLLGIRENRHYPTEKFWRLAQGHNVDVVFGMDSHTVEGAKDTASMEKALEICKKYNLNVLKRPKLIRL